MTECGFFEIFTIFLIIFVLVGMPLLIAWILPSSIREFARIIRSAWNEDSDNSDHRS